MTMNIPKVDRAYAMQILKAIEGLETGHVRKAGVLDKAVTIAMLIKAIEIDKDGNARGQASYMSGRPARASASSSAPGPAPAPRPASPTPGTSSPNPAKASPVTPNAPASGPDVKGMIENVGGQHWGSPTRTVKPLIGKGRQEVAHMVSHHNPMKAAQYLHQQLAKQGHVGQIRTQRIAHADGSTAHLYSFDHHDANGVKHTVHVIHSYKELTPDDLRPKAPRMPRSSTGSVGATPKSTTPKVPKAAVPKVPKAPTPPKPPAPAGPLPFDPGRHMSKPDFEAAYIRHMARSGATRIAQSAIDTAHAQHEAQYGDPGAPTP